MRIGICFGGYCPLHQGHMDLIMKAKKENDIAFIFVCGYENDRGGDFLPLLKRYRLIKNFLEDETAKVLMINDTELGLDESMSDANWKIWSNEVLRQLKDFGIDSHSDITWYIAEPPYKESLSKIDSHWSFFLADRSNPVSGTLCREQPLKYWNKIAQPFRGFFSHNILISGTASEGKTTLVEDISRYFGIPHSYEKGRDNCKLKTEPEFDVEDYIYNLYEQQKLIKELIASPQNPGVFISDTDNVVTLMYAHGHAGKKGFVLTERDYAVLHDIALSYNASTKWDKLFLVKPKNVDIVDDGERYMPDSDYEIRKGYYEFLKKTYEEFGYKYEELDGTYYENFCKVRDYINSLYQD